MVLHSQLADPLYANIGTMGWNDTQAAYPQRAVHQLFEDRARERPDALALIDPGSSTRLTYAELEAQANQLAHQLRRRGIAARQHVGVCLERSAGFVVALLGIWKAGAVAVPLDPAYPSEHLAYVLEDAAPRAVISSPTLREILPSTTAEVLEYGSEAIVREPTDSLPCDVGPDDVAHIFYTSGSTGRPKGVLGLHRATANQCAWLQRVSLMPNERVATKASVAFVIVVWEITWALLAGLPLVIVPTRAAGDPEQLTPILAEHGVTRLLVIPLFLRALLDRYPDLGVRVPSLRHFAFTGENMPRALARRLFEAVPGAVVRNIYGATESTAALSFEARQAPEQPVVPGGRPTPNSRVYILDEERQPVPAGEIGELYLAGENVSGGYLNRPDLTAERFVRDPFAADGSTMYRSGDLGRLLPSGEVELHGRSDHQVKVRGLRVELGEVEAALERHPNVRAAAATTWLDPLGDTRLAGYVEVRGEGAGEAELRIFLARSLPDAMVPSRISILEALPRTASGKLDRRSLPVPKAAKLGSGGPPRTPLEQAIARGCGRVLGLDGIGLDDDFFQIGGDSLKAVELATELASTLRRAVSAPDVFERRTVRDLATWLDRSPNQDTDVERGRRRAALRARSRP